MFLCVHIKLLCLFVAQVDSVDTGSILAFIFQLHLFQRQIGWQEEMDFLAECRTVERRQSSGDGLTGKHEKKRATSLDELTYSERLSLKSGSHEREVTKPATVTLDDCSLYTMPKSKHRCMRKLHGTMSSDAIVAERKTYDKTRCICHFLRKEKSQELKKCYDLVALRGPKFLFRSLELADSTSTSFKTPGSVPFKWEELPGKPRRDAAISKPDRSLQLPPRLLNKTSTGDCSFPDFLRPHQVKAVSQNRERNTTYTECRRKRPISCTSLIFRSDEVSSLERNPSSVSNLREACSPRSILTGPTLNSTSSSSDPISISDSENCTQAAPLFEIWSDLAFQAKNISSSAVSENLSFHPEWQLIPYVESPLEDLAPFPEPEPVRRGNYIVQGFKAAVKFFGSRHRMWKRGKEKHKTKGFSEVELWAPTLATYFQRIDLDKSSTMNEKLRLLDDFEDEKMTFEKRYEGLFSASIIDDATSSLSSECVCRCKSWKQQTEHLSKVSANNDIPISKQSHVNISNKESIDFELPGRSVYNDNGNCSPAARLFLLSPSKIVSMKWKRRRLKLQSRDDRKTQKVPRSFNVLVKTIKRAFVSRKQSHQEPRI